MNKESILLISIILVCFILGGAYYLSIEKSDCNKLNKEILENSNSGNKTSNTIIGGIEWNKRFEKNLEIEKVYKDLESLPIHHTLCIPVKKYLCDGINCKDVKPNVFILLGKNEKSSTISRCDIQGCDTYDSVYEQSGDYKNIQPAEPKGFIFKMAYNTIDKKYFEAATLGLDVYLTYGYCLYDFELPK